MERTIKAHLKLQEMSNNHLAKIIIALETSTMRKIPEEIENLSWKNY